MIKVLHVVTRVDIGGISTLLYNYIQNIDKNKVSFHIVAIDTGNIHGYHEAFENIGVKVMYMPQALLSRMLFLFRLIGKQKYDIVHSHIELQSAIYLLLARVAGTKKTIAHAHLSRQNLGIKNALMRFILNSVVSKRLGASDLTLEAVFGRKYLQKSYVLNNAIDLERFSFNELRRHAYRKEFGLDENFVLGFVGRLSYLKNIDFLLDVFIQVSKLTDKAKLLIIGDGEDAHKLTSKLKPEGLQDRLVWLKSRNDVHLLLNAIDILLLPSHSEGLPLVLVETQANSLQALVSDKITKLVQLTRYITYLSIESQHIDKWVNKIMEYREGYERLPTYNELTEAGFNVKKEAENLLKIYSDLISQD